MKTLYLRADTKEELVKDIIQLFPDYNGETDYSDGTNHLHYIGDIAIQDAVIDEKGKIIKQPIFSGKQHCDILLNQIFENEEEKENFLSQFKTIMPKPNTPKHLFA
jgi:hypothetical protein